MFVSCTVFVLSGRGLCVGLITRPEESYRLWCVSECDKVKINNLDTCCEQVEEVKYYDKSHTWTGLKWRPRFCGGAVRSRRLTARGMAPQVFL
jgi:hypothetical protein